MGSEKDPSYQPYADWVSTRIHKNINKYGEDALDTYYDNTSMAVEKLKDTFIAEKAALGAVNTNAENMIDG